LTALIIIIIIITKVGVNSQF